MFSGSVLHELKDNEGTLVCKFPLISLENVYVFPGIPAYLEKGFDHLEKVFHNPNTRFYVREVYINEEEKDILGEMKILHIHYSFVINMVCHQ